MGISMAHLAVPYLCTTLKFQDKQNQHISACAE